MIKRELESGMTVKEVLEVLQGIEEENKELMLYVCDEDGNNLPIKSISLYDSLSYHSLDNPLGVNF